VSAGIVKRSVDIAGHRTSISLEAEFWDALKDAAAVRHVPLRRLVAEIDAERGAHNLSSAIRVFVLAEIRRRAHLAARSDPDGERDRTLSIEANGDGEG
jgi:predicted DNA-binding ribbon-helix-helix protein